MREGLTPRLHGVFVRLCFVETAMELAVATALLNTDVVRGNAGHELRFREDTIVEEVEDGGRAPKPPRGSVVHVR
jgi:hypothetical protein